MFISYVFRHFLKQKVSCKQNLGGIMETPYIGITGFMKREQVESVLMDLSLPPGYKLMVGGLAHGNHYFDKDARGEDKKPPRHPKTKDLPKIFIDDPRCLNLIHLHVPDNANHASDMYVLVYNYIHICQDAGVRLDGFQLNMNLPNQEDLFEIRDSNPDLKIVIQLNSKVINRFKTPSLLAKRLRQYAGIANYLLFDKSGGTGKSINPDEAMDYTTAFDDQHLPTLFGLGYAGGLSADTFPDLLPFLKMHRFFKPFSFDAEGKLHDPETGELSLNRCKDYLKVATETINLARS